MFFFRSENQRHRLNETPFPLKVEDKTGANSQEMSLLKIRRQSRLIKNEKNMDLDQKICSLENEILQNKMNLFQETKLLSRFPESSKQNVRRSLNFDNIDGDPSDPVGNTESPKQTANETETDKTPIFGDKSGISKEKFREKPEVSVQKRVKMDRNTDSRTMLDFQKEFISLLEKFNFLGGRGEEKNYSELQKSIVKYLQDTVKSIAPTNNELSESSKSSDVQVDLEQRRNSSAGKENKNDENEAQTVPPTVKQEAQEKDNEESKENQDDVKHKKKPSKVKKPYSLETKEKTKRGGKNLKRKK